MKSFLEEYGMIIVSAMIILVLVASAAGIGDSIFKSQDSAIKKALGVEVDTDSDSNNPVGGENSIRWDGDTVGREFFVIDESTNLVHVSNRIPDIDNLSKGGSIEITMGEYVETLDISLLEVVPWNDCYLLSVGEIPVIALVPHADFSTNLFKKDGTYFISTEIDGEKMYVSSFTFNS